MEKNLLKNKKINSLCESIGNFIEYWGFKNIQGQIWFILFVSNQAYSTRELREMFGISKALMSNVINELIDYQVVLNSGKGKYGVDLFIANPNPLKAIFYVIKSRELVLLQDTKNKVKILNKEINEVSEKYSISKNRLKVLNTLINLSEKAMKNFTALNQVRLSSWKNIF